MNKTIATLPDIHSDSASHSKQSLRLWLRLLTCCNFVEKRVRLLLKTQFETTLPRFDVLAALEKEANGLSMSDLSQKLMVSNGNVTGVVSRLEEEGLLTKEPAPEDQRFNFVRLTAEGVKEFRRMAKAHEKWIDDMFGSISDSEIAKLLKMLDGVKESLQTYQKKR